MYKPEHNITLLFFHNKPKSPIEAKALLEANGYAGRNKVFVRKKHGKATDSIKVSIMLPASCHWYDWPLENTYNLRKQKLDVKNKMRVNPNIRCAMEQFIYFPHLFKPNLSIEQIYFTTKYNTHVQLRTAQELVYLMKKSGLLGKDNTFVLKTQDEIDEITDSLFKTEYYYLIS